MEKTRETFKARVKAFAIKKWNSFKMNANIVRELVKKSIKVQYRNSVIGALWTVLNPLLNMLVMYLVFSVVLRYGDEPTYPLYIFCGNIMFSFVRAATTQSLTSMVANRGLLTKNKISQFVFPIANNLSAVVNFGFSSIALLGVMGVVSVSAGKSFFTPNLFLVILMLPALFLFSYGLSLVLSSMYVFFRDTQHFYNVFLTLWTYLTPIFWKTTLMKPNANDSFKLETIKKILNVVINCNPMYHFVEYFRDIVFDCVSYSYISSGGHEVVVEGVKTLETFPTLGILYLIGLLFFGIGTLIFSLTRRRFIYYI